MTDILPLSWVETDVASVCDVLGGGTPSTKRGDYWDGGVPWITSADIYGIDDIRPRKHISSLGISSSATNLMPRGSIVVVTRVSLGKVAIVEEPLCFSQDSQGLVFNGNRLHGLFLTYYLSQAVQRFRYEGRGTTISGVTKKQLRELPVLLPPLPEQHRIVAEIEKQFTPAGRLRRCAETSPGQSGALPGQRSQGRMRGQVGPHPGGTRPSRGPRVRAR